MSDEDDRRRRDRDQDLEFDMFHQWKKQRLEQPGQKPKANAGRHRPPAHDRQLGQLIGLMKAQLRQQPSQQPAPSQAVAAVSSQPLVAASSATPVLQADICSLQQGLLRLEQKMMDLSMKLDQVLYYLMPRPQNPSGIFRPSPAQCLFSACHSGHMLGAPGATFSHGMTLPTAMLGNFVPGPQPLSLWCCESTVLPSASLNFSGPQAGCESTVLSSPKFSGPQPGCESTVLESNFSGPQLGCELTGLREGGPPVISMAAGAWAHGPAPHLHPCWPTPPGMETPRSPQPAMPLQPSLPLGWRERRDFFARLRAWRASPEGQRWEKFAAAVHAALWRVVRRRGCVGVDGELARRGLPVRASLHAIQWGPPAPSSPVPPMPA